MISYFFICLYSFCLLFRVGVTYWEWAAMGCAGAKKGEIPTADKAGYRPGRMPMPV